jgi:hypothetical protein
MTTNSCSYSTRYSDSKRSDSMDEYNQMVIMLGYDPYDDYVDPDKAHDQMKEEEARDYYGRLHAEST